MKSIGHSGNRLAVRLGIALACAVATLTAVVGLTTARASGAFPGRNGRLVFQREMPAGDHTQADLWTMTPQGAGLRRLTHTPNRNEFDPQWNAAGTQIAFWRTHAPFGYGSIWVMNADGSDQRRLTRGIDARGPAWDPTGKRLVFSSGASGRPDLWVLRVSDGALLRQLTSGPGLDFEPAWSPDGTRVAFTRGSETGDVGDIYVLHLRSGRLTHVTTGPLYDHQVAWGPQGSRLVFERDADRSFSIVTVRPGGCCPHVLTSGHFDVGPAFSPNGRWIAFGSDRGGVLFGDNLWLMRADGTDLHRITRLAYSEGFPDWRPLPTAR